MDLITYGIIDHKKADVNNSHLTGEPTAPTPDLSDSSDRIATTKYVNDAIEAGGGGGTGKTYILSREGKLLTLTGSDSSVSEVELPYTCMTTQEWSQQPPEVSEPGALYIWTDYKKDSQNRNIPGLKIGDGNAYIADLPFIDEIYAEHIADETAHISQADRDIWDNNVTCFIGQDEPNKLIFKIRNTEE